MESKNFTLLVIININKNFSKKVQNNPRFKHFNFIHIHFNKYPGISKDFDHYYNPGSSGANTVQIGIMKGYKKIVLLGCDCNYIQRS